MVEKTTSGVAYWVCPECQEYIRSGDFHDCPVAGRVYPESVDDALLESLGHIEELLNQIIWLLTAINLTTGPECGTMS